MNKVIYLVHLLFSTEVRQNGTNPMATTKSDSEPTPLQTSSALSERRLGRPPRHTEPTCKITVVLLHRHEIFLDRLLLQIKERTRVRISKSEILRALTEAIAESEIDLSSSRSEHEVKDI